MAVYEYTPSLVAAIIFASLFGITTAAQLFQMVRWRAWFFTPFLIGGLFEVVGFAARAVSASQKPDYEVAPYIVQILLILLAPALYAASMYMVISRLVRFLGAERHSLIRPRLLSKVFVIGDVASFLLQAAGGGKLANAKSPEELDNGEKTILTGLGVQIIFFGMFIVLVILFLIRITRDPTPRALGSKRPWRRLVWALLVSSAFVMVRSVFRVVEYVQGSDGELQQKEVYMYIFDVALMFLVSVSFNLYHPGLILKDETHGYETCDEAGMSDGAVRMVGVGSGR